MSRVSALEHEFVEYLPEDLREGTLYVSMHFATVAHKCCCGCGNDVYTPLSPARWKLIFDGESVSLHPSVGNWGFACRSHYWIRDGRVCWAASWSQQEVDAGRAEDAAAMARYFVSTPGGQSVAVPSGIDAGEEPKPREPWWRRLFRGLFG